MKALLGNTYCQDFLDYIYLWPDGRRVKAQWLTTTFHRFLRNHGLPMVRFHDLRHSCATLARHEGVPMEDIQKWLGHSTITTTEGIYALYDDTQSLETAKKISGAIDEGLKEDKAKVMK
ncbi:MAG: tyrosine-type recombinase/integrase [Bacilli bacterium]|jgi:integrase|nr:tyrosine-type recombinase/integrase [Bacilli bacterium]